jgi:hypothetical protein
VLLRRYVHGSGADEPLVRYDGSTLRFLHADERGSIIATSQADGSIWNVSVYDEYGVRGIWNDGTFQYTGQVWLGELDCIATPAPGLAGLVAAEASRRRLDLVFRLTP